MISAVNLPGGHLDASPAVPVSSIPSPQADPYPPQLVVGCLNLHAFRHFAAYPSTLAGKTTRILPHEVNSW